MIKTYIIIAISYLLLSNISLAQTTIQKAEDQEIDVDLVELCHEQEQINKNIEPNSLNLTCTKVQNSFSEINSLADHTTKLLPFLTATNPPEVAKANTCSAIYSMASEHKPSMNMEVKDEDGHTWRIRFHFGYNRIQYSPTDINIQSSPFTGTIRNFQFDERTSGEHYDPKTWKDIQSGLNWIDEPTNTIGISIENNKNAFYLTSIHPKLLKRVTATPGDSEASSEIDPSLLKNNLNEIEIQNTHRFMNYQIGYGRKITIFGNNKDGKLTYIPRIDIGITFGAAQTYQIDKDNQLKEHFDKEKIQGTNYSIGHRLEYQKGIFAVFVEQRQTSSSMDHAFLDGSANYHLDYSATTFGIVVDILKFKSK